MGVTGIMHNSPKGRVNYHIMVKWGQLPGNSHLWSRFQLIICTPPLVRRVSSFLHAFSKNSWILSNFQFTKLPPLISKLRQWISLLFYQLSPIFRKNKIKCINPYKTYIRSLRFWKRVAKQPTTRAGMASLSRLYVIKKSELVRQERDQISDVSLFGWSVLAIT